MFCTNVYYTHGHGMTLSVFVFPLLRGRLREVKKNWEIQTTSIKSSRSRLREVVANGRFNYSNLFCKILVIWINGRLREVVAYER